MSGVNLYKLFPHTIFVLCYRDALKKGLIWLNIVLEKFFSGGWWRNSFLTPAPKVTNVKFFWMLPLCLWWSYITQHDSRFIIHHSIHWPWSYCSKIHTFSKIDYESWLWKVVAIKCRSFVSLYTWQKNPILCNNLILSVRLITVHRFLSPCDLNLHFLKSCRIILLSLGYHIT